MKTKKKYGKEGLLLHSAIHKSPHSITKVAKALDVTRQMVYVLYEQDKIEDYYKERLAKLNPPIHIGGNGQANDHDAVKKENEMLKDENAFLRQMLLGMTPKTKK